MAKRMGSTTISADTLKYLLHDDVVADTRSAIRDWQGDGSLAEGSFLTMVEQVGYYFDSEGNLEVEWDATIREPKAD